jgi:ATP-binding cassette subfamily C protein
MTTNDLFEQFGQEVAVQNFQPLEVGDPEQVYLVTAGQVELFYTERTTDGHYGTRQRLVTVMTGQLLWGMDSGTPTSVVLASGVIGTRVRRLSAADFAERSPLADAVELAAAVDQWIGTLSEFLANATGGLQIEVPLRAAGSSTLPAAKLGGCATRVLWVTGHAPLRFLGQSELAIGEEVALAGGCWVNGDADTHLSALTTADLQANGRLRGALAGFHQRFAEVAFLGLQLGVVDELHRQKSKSEYREAASRDAVNALLAVTDDAPDDGAEEPGTGRRDDILLASVRKVAAQQNIMIRRHPDIKASNSNGTNLGLLAKSSGFRTRRVLLEGAWWTEDHGPMLGYRINGGTPVAILTVKPGKYEIFDPSTGHTEPVTPDVVRTLMPVGQSFYRNLPQGPANAKTFLKYASFGLQNEFRMVAVLSVAAGILGMLSPMLTSKIFDSVIPASDSQMLFHYVAVLINAAVATAGFEVVRSIAVLRVEGRMDYAGQSAIWSRLLDLPSTFFRNYTAGDLASRAHAVDNIRSIISHVGVTALLGGTMILFQGFSMVMINMKLAFVGVGLILVLVLCLVVANRMQLRYQRQEYAIRGVIAGLALQLMSGVSKIRVAAAEDHAFRQWAIQFAKQKRVGFVIGRIQNFVQVLQGSFPVICSMVIFFFYAKFKASPEGAAMKLTTGQFIAFNAAFSAVLGAATQLGMATLQLLEIIPIFERVKPILTEPPEVTDDRRHPGELRGNVELYHVNFRYEKDGPLILKNLDLKIRKGEFVALVGPSGSGKSTVLRLLLGFETPESGYVYYEGQDLATLDLREVRRQIGAVLQTSQLMPTTIHQNIISASTTLTVADSERAAKMSGLDADIKQMPMGMHTVVSEGSGGFSGGQKQRLMIARALVMTPRIVLFDEATSALDNRTQKIVTDSLRAMDATRITIAHRLSTVVDADRIIVLDQGVIVESGTYQELMDMGGVFYDLARRQQTEGESS